MPHNFSILHLFFALLLIPQLAAAQAYQFETGVPVQQGQESLPLAWTGGLNAVQASQADLDGDGQQELVLFDRSSTQVQVFAQTSDGWIWLPAARYQFPADITNWLLLVDYNGDGQKDIFTFTAAGIRVFDNTAAPGQPAAWSLAYPLLTYPGSNSEVNLLVNSTDIPLLADTDEDGDLDIAAFDPAGNGTIRWYKNVGVEQFGRTDTLAYELADRHWGGISECHCRELALEYTSCPDEGGRASQRPLHAGGKSLLWKDLSGDGVPDLLLSDEECALLYYLPNSGTGAQPIFDTFETGLPGAQTDPDFNFPTAYAVGNDILVSTNLKNAGQEQNLKQSLWLYQQQNAGEYALIKKDFLQDKMLDTGEEARPAVADLDGDGDLDLLLGSKGLWQADEYYAGLQLYENTGTPDAPAFQFKEADFLGLSAAKYQHVQPQFADYDGDGAPDLLLSVFDVAANKVRSFLYLNQAGVNQPAIFETTHTLEIPIALSTLDYPFWYDVSGDGLLDALVGRFDGSLRLYTNTGTAEAPVLEVTHPAYKDFLLDNVLRHLIPTVGDANADGQPDLLVSDATGSIRILYNFLEESATASEAAWLMVKVGEVEQSPRLGDRSWPLLAQLWAAEMPALLVGQIGGGLVLLRNTELITSPGQEETSLQVYPNPNNNSPVTIKVNAAAEIRVLNMLGQVIGAWQATGGQPLQWAPQLPPGMYVVEARFSKGRKTKKLILGP